MEYLIILKLNTNITDEKVVEEYIEQMLKSENAEVVKIEECK